MSIIGSNILAGVSGQAGYNLNNSLRFRASNSAFLSRTPASTTNRTTWTWSGWVKRGALSSGSYMDLFSALSGGSDFTEVRFHFNVNDDTLVFTNVVGGVSYGAYSTNLFRDPSAWYHIVCSVDTTQATNTNRVKLYVNGVQVTQNAVGSGYPAQNVNTAVNATNIQNIGNINTYGRHFDGYMTEINFIDGSQLTPSSFGETSTTTGSWIPKKYTGTYGTNGFYLKFADASAATAAAIGKDSSGNGNNWTPSGISVTAGVTYDAMIDVPTNTSATVANYCVINPLSNLDATTLAAGNLNFTQTTGSSSIFGTLGVSSGQWYWEVICQSGVMVGVADTQRSGGTYPGAFANSCAWDTFYTLNSSNTHVTGTFTRAGTISGSAGTAGQVIGVALDMNAGTIVYYINGTVQNSGNAVFTNITGTVFPLLRGSTTTSSVNFGQRPFAYTAPSGHIAINTYNLPTPTILQGNKYMDATLYTGNATVRSITNAGTFKPDFIWIKSRSGAGYHHHLMDSVRGANKLLESDQTLAEQTSTDQLTSFNSNGFSLGADTAGPADREVNESGNSYVGWQWQAGQGTTSSNTSGTITSTVSVNTTAGFSVVTYTGTGANATVGHGLGVAPKMVIIKTRNSAGWLWVVYHASVGNTGYLRLQATDATTTSSAVWQNTTPSSSVVTIGTDGALNTNTNTYVMYAWAEIAGYSKAFSYTGNGSTDGSFVFCGFRPKFVLLKSSSTADDWYIHDSTRNTYNVVDLRLSPNLSSAEVQSAVTVLDFLSNGFKLRTSNGGWNGSGNTYIGIAFAENPFKNSNAR